MLNHQQFGQPRCIVLANPLESEIQTRRAAAQIVGISFADKPGEAAYIPLHHSGPDAPEQLPFDAVMARLKPWLEDESAKKIGQNLKYDRHVFLNHGVNLAGVQHDTLLQSYVLEAHKTHNLEALAERHLGRKGLSYEDLCGKGAHQIPFAQVDVAKATTYSGEDSEMCLHLHSVLWPQIEADAGRGDGLRRRDHALGRVADTRPARGIHGLIDRSARAEPGRRGDERSGHATTVRSRRPANSGEEHIAEKEPPPRRCGGELVPRASQLRRH